MAQFPNCLLNFSALGLPFHYKYKHLAAIREDGETGAYLMSDFEE